MTTITTEALKDYSVKVVEDFINNKTPLSEGIAKCASDMELNPEQTKRMVETTNTIAYLKLQKEASDKTMEFPLADYTQVMKHMCLPETPDGTLLEKQFEEQIKTAADVTFEASFNPDKQMVQSWMMREMLANRAALQKLAVEKAEVLMNIGDLQRTMFKDDRAIDKLAEVCDEQMFVKLAILINKPDQPVGNYVFKTAELKDARKLVDLFKRAEELVSEAQKRQEIEKKAVALAMAGHLGRAVGGLFSGGIAAGVRTGTAAAKGLGKTKVIHPIDVAGAALTEPSAKKNVWDNLQGSQKRF
jgi:hypothetical protein